VGEKKLETKNNPQVVNDDVVVSLDYTLTVDGQVVDSTEGDEPLQFLQGHQNIIPGLERELTGMRIGQSKTVTVPAVEAYGEVDPDNIVDVPRSEFPSEIPLETGIELEVKNADGEVLTATIAEVTTDSVQLDFNHPLAGKELTFNVTVVDLRTPTEEEMAHGHVHVDDYDEEDEEFEEDDEEFEELLDEETEDDLEYEDLDEFEDEDDDTSGLDHSDSNSRPH
jgi:FKBP-type peptidyl-prolyl cis-trans isomerase SlyD